GFLNLTSFGKVLAIHHSAQSDADVDALVAMTFHEGFHFTGQKFKDSLHLRGMQYPEDAMSRYLRFEIIRGLRRALEGEALGGAAYWAREFESSSKGRKALIHEVDRIEGSAEYVEALAVAISRTGCDASDEMLIS